MLDNTHGTGDDRGKRLLSNLLEPEVRNEDTGALPRDPIPSMTRKRDVMLKSFRTSSIASSSFIGRIRSGCAWVVEGHRQGYRAGGSVTVPNKALYAEAEGDSLTEAMEQLFNRLRKELLRHRAMVRKEYLKKRKYAWQEDLKQAQAAARRRGETFKRRFPR